MTVEILCVGTEILLGNIVNTNAQYLSEKLSALGFAMYHQTVVGDNPERLREALSLSIKRSDIVITTGGLGPTQDDLTKEIIAASMNRSLVIDEKAKIMLEERLKSYHISCPQSNYKQAYVPNDSIVLYNNNGTAPGAIIEENNKTVIMLPGPPKEMTLMFEESVVPYLKSKTEGIIFSVTAKMIGIGESQMAEMADDLIAGTNPTAAPYAKTGECQLRITAKAADEAEAKALIEPVLKEVSNRFEDYIYTYEADENLEDVVVKLLKQKNMHISFAESCTGGMLASRLINVPGSSSVINESYITYSNEAKERIIKVKADTLKNHGAVSPETATEMAKGVAMVSGSDIGIGITGIAGPDGGTKEKPVGLVYIALSYKDEIIVKKLERKGSRESIRYGAVTTALYMAWKLLKTI